MIGRTILHYEILEKIGKGGMGVVYKAHDNKLDRTVALKFLPQHLMSSEEDKQRFIREAKAAAALNHPHICTIYNVDEHKGKQFIVMEYVDGMTLRQKSDVRDQTSALRKPGTWNLEPPSTTRSKSAKLSPKRTKSESSTAILNRIISW